MGLFKHERPAAPDEVEPFNQWRIVTQFDNGETLTLQGSVYLPEASAAMLPYIDAIASGLRAGGYSADVQIIRNQTSSR